MIKTSCVHLLSVFKKLFNHILLTRMYPSLWRKKPEGIITPILKLETKQTLAITEVFVHQFSCIINERPLNFVESRNMLHPSQIGFLKEKRTSDCMFTLRTLKNIAMARRKFMHFSLISKRLLIPYGMMAYCTDF